MKQYIEESPENAAKFSDSFVDAVRDITGQTLDYSKESIAILELIIDSFRSDGAPLDGVPDSLFSMGCYLGEIFVRNSQWAWVLSANTPLKDFCSVALVLQTGQSTFCNPIDKVSKRFENGEEDSLVFFYERFNRNATSFTAGTGLDLPSTLDSRVSQDSLRMLEALRKEAESGSADAQYELAERYRKGNGIERDYSQCVYWYTQAAAQGLGAAINNLADKYEHGLGVAQDLSKALSLYLEAADKDIVAAWYSLGMMYYDGRGVARDLKQAIEWMGKAASFVYGFSDAEEQLEKMERELALQTFREGEVLLKNANNVDTETLCEAASQVWSTAPPDSMRIAFELYLLAANRGHAQSQYQVGWQYEQGLGIPIDKAQSLAWYQRSAGQDNVDALKRLGAIYHAGKLVQQDKSKASRCFQQAALAAWLSEGQYWLTKAPWAKGSHLFEFANTLDRPDDLIALNMAFRLYLRAAEMGHRNAKATVAAWYEAGKGIGRNKEEALYWWKQAADQGHPEALRKTKRPFWKFW